MFAMPSVRAKLGLAARPAADPDVKAKRLVQVDGYLNNVLYGSVDTMAAHYGGRRTTVIAAAPKAPATTKPAAVPVKKPVVAKTAAVPPKKPPDAPKVADKKPPPVVKPPLIMPAASTEKPKSEDSSGGFLSSLVPPVFKKKAKLVIPPGHETDAAPSQKTDPSPVLELPKDLQIGRMGDAVKDLKALEALPGYVKGGPVSHELSPYKIAGSAWKSPSTYYYLRGRITPGDKIDEKSIESGTLIFYKAPAK